MSILRQSLSVVLSITLTTGLVAALTLLKRLNAPTEAGPKLQRLEINAALPPPPPPPPTTRSQQSAPDALPLDLTSAGTSPLSLPPATLRPSLKVEDLEAPVSEVRPLEFDINVTASMQEFGLAQLDGRPRLLTDLRIQFPAALRAKGVTKIRVRAQVVIDTTGAVTLRRIVENPYPEIEPQLRALMGRARFTPPEKDGERVRAAFVWPLVFSAT
ncbi:MAG: hypothetical protein AAGB27_10685 [Pseudomonadota bacterium]